MQLRAFEGVGGKRDQYQIDPRQLKVRAGFNIRDLSTPSAREKLDVLKAQIKAEGVLEAIEIEFDGVTPWINEGHRRHMVVMELIAEGHEFKTVPCIQERGNLKEDKRTLHMLMRKKEDYEPLEYAAGIARMIEVYGWDKSDLAISLGFQSKASIEHYMKMLALPDPVQEHIRQGDVSPSLALKMMKEEPDKVAEMIRANKEENKRLGVGSRMKQKHKVTPKTIKRDHPKQKPGATENDRREGAISSEGQTPEAPSEINPVNASGPTTPTTQAGAGPAREAPSPGDDAPAPGLSEDPRLPPAPQLQMPPRQNVKSLVDALEPFARLAHQYDFNEKSDDDLAEVSFRDLKRAWVAFAAATGQMEAA